MTDATVVIFDQHSILYDLFFNNPRFWSDFTWDSQIIGGLGTFIIIIITISIFWYQLFREKKEKKKIDELNRRRRCIPLRNEIISYINSFNAQNRITNLAYNIDYINMVLNTNVHDSMLYSGLFHDFDWHLQDKLSATYFRINIRNEVYRYKIDLEAHYSMSQKSRENTSYYYRKRIDCEQIITIREIEIIRLLPLLLELFKKELSNL